MGCIVIRKIAFDKEEDTILETFPIGGPNHLDWFKQNGYNYKGESFFAKGRRNVAYATYYDKTTDFPTVSAKRITFASCPIRSKLHITEGGLLNAGLYSLLPKILERPFRTRLTYDGKEDEILRKYLDRNYESYD